MDGHVAHSSRPMHFFYSNTEFHYVFPFHKSLSILVFDPDTKIPNIRTHGFQKYINLGWSRHW